MSSMRVVQKPMAAVAVTSAKKMAPPARSPTPDPATAIRGAPRAAPPDPYRQHNDPLGDPAGLLGVQRAGREDEERRRRAREDGVELPADEVAVEFMQFGGEDAVEARGRLGEADEHQDLACRPSADAVHAVGDVEHHEQFRREHDHAQDQAHGEVPSVGGSRLHRRRDQRAVEGPCLAHQPPCTSSLR